MTGGRLTNNSNDYTIGYARARRDQGCRYTLGFYDRKPEADKRHVVEVLSRRKGIHLLYAARYTFPSKQKQKELAVEAAYLVPAQFEGGGLRAHLFPLQPQDAKTWNAILAVDFPITFEDAPEGSKREFGVVLRRGSEVAHAFSRSITLARNADDARTSSRVTFVEPVTLRPGTYALTAVLVDPKNPRPFGRAVDLTVPDIPKREAILAGPILGRRRGDDVVVYGGGDAKGTAGDRVGDRDTFRPLLIDDVDRAEPLAALTHVCVVKGKPNDGPWSLSRRLETSDGASAGSLADQSILLAAGKEVFCERWFDELPVQRLKIGRYAFHAVLAEAGAAPSEAQRSSAPFAVSPAKAP